jgi:energy-coupling factor transporter ATP-binding protein EcfA2
MKQKLAVANALPHAPALLILDEPTAGVDVGARAELWSMLASERERALVVVSTSYLDEAAACDRIAYLDAGRVVATGTPEGSAPAVPLELYRAWGDDRPRHRARRSRPPLRPGRPRDGPLRPRRGARDRSPGRRGSSPTCARCRRRASGSPSRRPSTWSPTLLALARGMRVAA